MFQIFFGSIEWFHLEAGTVFNSSGYEKKNAEGGA